MDQKEWMSLKSGTDVRGVALEGVKGEPVNLTNEAISGIMKAFRMRPSGAGKCLGIPAARFVDKTVSNP